MAKCPICNEVFNANDSESIRNVQQARGLNSLISSAKERDDKQVLENLNNISLPFMVHVECGKNYTRPSSIKAGDKRKLKVTKTVHLLECLNQVKVQFRNSNDTAKLWLTYMEMIEDLMMFIGSIRLSNEGYYHILCKMIPIFHSAGHLAYAKYARLYIQQLRDCQDWMSPQEHKQFFEEGKSNDSEV